MELNSRLELATIRAQQEDDLPDFLAVRIFAVAEQLSGRSVLHAEIEELLEQLSLYDTYAQTGYIGMGVNHYILEGTIVRIEAKLQECLQSEKE